MTMGLNTVREMSVKNPLIMDADSLNYLAEYKTFKNRNVSAAAKSLINQFREINPKLLHKKFRGKDQCENVDEEYNHLLQYGEEKVQNCIPGAELLENDSFNKKYTGSGIPIYMDRILDDSDFKRIKLL